MVAKDVPTADLAPKRELPRDPSVRYYQHLMTTSAASNKASGSFYSQEKYVSLHGALDLRGACSASLAAAATRPRIVLEVLSRA
jgi:hypothetical protein